MRAAFVLALAGCGRINFAEVETPEPVVDRCQQSAGLVAYWPFDEAAGIVANDLTTHRQSAELTGNATWIPGAIGSGLKFDGTADFAIVSSTAGLDFNNGSGSFSVSYWVNPLAIATGNDGRAFEIAFCTGASYIFTQIYEPERAGMTVYDHLDNNADAQSEFGVIQLNRWTHVAHVIDRSSAIGRTYIDGVISGPVRSLSDLVGVIDCSGPTEASFGGWQSNFFYRGGIDDVRVFARTLSDSEVLQLAQLTTTDCPF